MRIFGELISPDVNSPVVLVTCCGLTAPTPSLRWLDRPGANPLRTDAQDHAIAYSVEARPHLRWRIRPEIATDDGVDDRAIGILDHLRHAFDGNASVRHVLGIDDERDAR